MKTIDAKEFRGRIDFGILTIREDEYRAVLQRFQPQWVARGERTYDIAVLKAPQGEDYWIAILRASGQGHGFAQAATSDLIVDLDPTWLVLVGIGGAVPEYEFTLGDVVAATYLHDFSVTAALDGGVTEIAAAGGPMHKEVLDRISRLEALRPIMEGWNSVEAVTLRKPDVDLISAKVVGDSAWQDKVLRTLTHHFGTPASSSRPPIVTAQAVASGNKLMKDPALLKDWLNHARDLKAVEMELPGVYQAAHRTRGDVPVLAIRGISDVIGLQRDPAWTEYACQTAASLALAFLRTGPINAKPKVSPLNGHLPLVTLRHPVIVKEIGIRQARCTMASMGAILKNTAAEGVVLEEIQVSVRQVWDLPRFIVQSDDDLHAVEEQPQFPCVEILPHVGHRSIAHLGTRLSGGEEAGIRLNLFSRSAANRRSPPIAGGQPQYGLIVFWLEPTIVASFGALALRPLIVHLHGYYAGSLYQRPMNSAELTTIRNDANTALKIADDGALADDRLLHDLRGIVSGSTTTFEVI